MLNEALGTPFLSMGYAFTAASWTLIGQSGDIAFPRSLLATRVSATTARELEERLPLQLHHVSPLLCFFTAGPLERQLDPPPGDRCEVPLKNPESRPSIGPERSTSEPLWRSDELTSGQSPQKLPTER
ncbi:hypothetical protein CIHG_03614 [Coccidioides immitis H538.4]|uniref:Uncharacterized protein n=3 Tax=Coccidioides immitis TaxID=5501 RepID=A0A0J8TUZ6_COCIT|nr:hypothetical protein CIRG_04802 [Coccidioides immitis RMSCC 2394]KMU77647.1 hypothetical protein CISG_01404 [Coccidioides immitis RMSCC 3703]KMU85573.1 hypothetical protein CIHG_03614 [Coccidioides immitis H538.4]